MRRVFPHYGWKPASSPRAIPPPSPAAFDAEPAFFSGLALCSGVSVRGATHRSLTQQHCHPRTCNRYYGLIRQSGELRPAWASSAHSGRSLPCGPFAALSLLWLSFTAELAPVRISPNQSLLSLTQGSAPRATLGWEMQSLWDWLPFSLQNVQTPGADSRRRLQCGSREREFALTSSAGRSAELSGYFRSRD